MSRLIIGSSHNLLEEAKALFLQNNPLYKEKLRAMDKVDALIELNDRILEVVNSALDDRRENYIHLLMLCCLENPIFFTKEPESISCIVDNGSPGQITAQHCVYHNLYDYLRAALEEEFSNWEQGVD